MKTTAFHLLIALVALATGTSCQKPKEAKKEAPDKIALIQQINARIDQQSSLPKHSPLGLGLLGESQESNQASLNQLLGTLVIELENGPALGAIRTLRQNQNQIELIKEREPNKENLEKIANLHTENDHTLDRLHTILQAEGFPLSKEQTKALAASPNAEDTTALLNAFASLRAISSLLEETMHDKPSATTAKKYYGAYCIMLIALDKIQKKTIDAIQSTHIKNCQQIQEKASKMQEQAAKTQALTASPEERKALEDSILTCQITIDQCRRTEEKLQRNLDILLAANQKLRTSIDAAKICHQTLSLLKESQSLATSEMKNIEAIEALTVPELATINFADPGHPTSPRHLPPM